MGVCLTARYHLSRIVQLFHSMSMSIRSLIVASGKGYSQVTVAKTLPTKSDGPSYWQYVALGGYAKVTCLIPWLATDNLPITTQAIDNSVALSFVEVPWPMLCESDGLPSYPLPSGLDLPAVKAWVCWNLFNVGKGE